MPSFATKYNQATGETNVLLAGAGEQLLPHRQLPQRREPNVTDQEVGRPHRTKRGAPRFTLAEAGPEAVFTTHVPSVDIVILGGKPGSGVYTAGGLVTEKL